MLLAGSVWVLGKKWWGFLGSAKSHINPATSLRTAVAV